MDDNTQTNTEAGIQTTGTQTAWEKSVLENLLQQTLIEQRRSRRWGIFFKSLSFLFLFAALFAILGLTGKRGEVSSLEKHTALIELNGVIAADSMASADKIINSLQQAFKDKNTQGVVLRINSPGGSPVQAGYINDEIRRLRARYPQIPLYAVVQDICASGGYYVAVAADKIYVDKASLIGSIGVLMDGFGFTGTMEKLGVERRLITAGTNKGFLDPYSPINPEQKKYAEQMIEQIHQQFIKVVKDGRGKRLKETPEMFSGLIWSGEKGIELGLADGLGSLDSVARDVFKAENIVDYTEDESFSEQLSRKLGASVSDMFWHGFTSSTFSYRIK